MLPVPELVPLIRTRPPPAHRTPAGTPLVRCTRDRCPLARQICLCRSEIHKDDCPPLPTACLLSRSPASATASPAQLQPATSSAQSIISLHLLLHHCIAASPALFDQALTRDARLFRRLASTPQASQLLQQPQPQQPQCLLSDLLTFLPARAPRPADLCLLCPNESRRPETKHLHAHNGYSSPWLSFSSSSMVSPDLIHGFTTGSGF
ncbi:hypothetical protein CCMA1212_009915 [Trichoderma ghanense]|uniref:Uncharacterized protein n=1 Tax=Trichoderma ghanense TaxID=65468 RepID=A0ABY2GQR9_9HYPO